MASTKKPFSYCPGGINFSELKTKSPSMARRIEKHQEQMSAPSPAPQLLPSAPSPANQQMVNPLFIQFHTKIAFWQLYLQYPLF